MIQLPQIEMLKKKYDGLPMQGLAVTAVLENGSCVLQYNPIYLDSLLALSVLKRGEVSGLQHDHEYFIPVPLFPVWLSPEGSPLYAASAFFPSSEWVESTVYYHKRAPSGRMSRGLREKKRPLKIVTIMGPDMERRVPVPSLVCTRLTAVCIGNLDEISELLKQILFLGKRRNLGTAMVIKWEIQEINISIIETFVRNGLLIRALPQEVVGVFPLLSISEPPVTVAWTQPYWKPTLFGTGWRIGTKAVFL